MYYVYVLKSKRDGQLYIGMTSNLDRRLHQHNTGQTRSIRSRIPFELLFSESFEDRTTARTREKYYKSGSGRELLRASFDIVGAKGSADLPAGRQA